MRTEQGIGLVAAMLWGILGSFISGGITFYVVGDVAASMTVVVACPTVTVFLYLLFERLGSE
jgi:hypothetical protein